MPADSDPMDPASYSTQPAPCAKCGALPTDACAKKDAWCEDSRRRFALRDSPWVRDADGGEAVTPAAPLSADELAEMRREFREAAESDAHGDFASKAIQLGGYVPRLLSALEALTAERDHLRDALNQTVQEACAAIDDELKPEIARLQKDLIDQRQVLSAALAQAEGLKVENERLAGALKAANANHEHFEREWYLACDREEALKAEVDRLTANVIDLSDQLKLEETCRIMREIEDDEELRRLCARGDDEGSPLDHDWYARHRAAVEAAHAAAKEAKREAECRNCRDGFPAYINPADWGACPDCGKRFGAAKEPVSDEAYARVAGLYAAMEAP